MMRATLSLSALFILTNLPGGEADGVLIFTFSELIGKVDQCPSGIQFKDCKYLFKFSVRPKHDKAFSTTVRDFQKNGSTIRFGSKNSVIKIPANMATTGSYMIKMSVYFVSRFQEHKFGRNYTFNYNVLGSESVTIGKDLHLHLKAEIQCEPGYYTNTCDRFCQPRNDSTGHYTCSPDGAPECLPSWSDLDSNCLKASCDPNPCLNNGTCRIIDKGAVCDCVDPAYGVRCEICKVYLNEFDECRRIPPTGTVVGEVVLCVLLLIYIPVGLSALSSVMYVTMKGDEEMEEEGEEESSEDEALKTEGEINGGDYMRKMELDFWL